MSLNNTANIIFIIVFSFFGLFMAFLGLGMLFSGPTNETEWTIALLGMLASFFLFYGARQTWQNNKRQVLAEKKEAGRLTALRGNRSNKSTEQVERNRETMFKNESIRTPAKDEEKTTSDQGNASQNAAEKEASTYEPKILAHWLYPKREWNAILSKLAQKTKKEELYTAFWFPVLFALVFWSMFWIGIIAGLAFGVLYIWFRVYFVKQKFALNKNQKEAEVIVTDSYLNVNGNFIHYGDGKYYLRELSQEQDAKLGQLLCFNIGWLTSKGLPAQMDLFLPVPLGKENEANAILSVFKAARK